MVETICGKGSILSLAWNSDALPVIHAGSSESGTRVRCVKVSQHLLSRTPTSIIVDQCITRYLLVENLSLSLRFYGHFPGESGLPGVYWSKGWWRTGGGGDNWSYKSCKAPVKSSPPINQHPVFYRPDALPVTQPTVSKHWREKYHIPWTSLPQAHLGVFQLCLSDH